MEKSRKCTRTPRVLASLLEKLRHCKIIRVSLTTRCRRIRGRPGCQDVTKGHPERVNGGCAGKAEMTPRSSRAGGRKGKRGISQPTNDVAGARG